MLRYGDNSNLREVQRQLTIKACAQFGRLGDIFEDDEYYDEPPYEFSNSELADMKNNAEVRKMNEVRVSKRTESNLKMFYDRPLLYAMIWGVLDADGEEAVRRHRNFEEARSRKDPLILWRIVHAAYLVCSTSQDAGSVRAKTRSNYASMQQSPFENISEYKQRWLFNLNAFIDSGNTEPKEEDLAYDFLLSLDPARYAGLKCDLLNEKSAGMKTFPATYTAMYQRASSYLVVSNVHSSDSLKTAFAALADDQRIGGRGGGRGPTPGRGAGRGGRGGRGRGDHKSPAAAVPSAKRTNKHKTGAKTSIDKSKLHCFNCGELGHFIRDCTKEKQDQGDDDGAYVSAVGLRAALAAVPRRLAWYLVVFDGGSNYSIFCNSKLLKKLRPPTADDVVLGIGGGISCASVGLLPGFFEVGMHVDALGNILSQHQCEELFEVEYLQNVHYIVHTEMYGSIVFKKYRNGLYCSDIRTWAKVKAVDGEQRADSVSLTTVAENRAKYSRRENLAADAAMNIVKSLGHPTERDVVQLVNSGANFTNLDITSGDVRRAFDIHGGDVNAIKGKTKKLAVGSNVVPVVVPDKPEQVMYSDVMHIDDHMYLITVVKPLDLVLTTPIKSQTTDVLGVAVESQRSALRERGYVANKLKTDPHRSLKKLRGRIPGLLVDNAGAGDHVVDVENRIKTFKERVRCVKSGLPFRWPANRTDDLVVYVTTRVNLMLSSVRGDGLTAKVRFTEKKMDARKELGLCLGDYAEVTDYSVTSNNTNELRTNSAVALWPKGNDNESWEFINLATGCNVSRSRWKVLPTTQLVIDRMNQLADKALAAGGAAGLNAGDVAAEPVSVVGDVPTTGVATDKVGNSGVAGVDDVAVISNTSGSVADVVGSTSTTGGATGVGLVEPDDIDHEDIPPPVEPGRGRRAAAVRGDEIRAAAVKARVIAGVRTRNYNFHITLRKGLKTRGAAAVTAIKEELKNLVSKETMKPVLLKDLSKTQRKKVIRSCLFLKEKFNSRGVFERLKARLVANGKQQDRADFHHTESPTASIVSVYVMLTVAAKEKRVASTHDIGSAFLNAKMTGETVHVKLDAVIAKFLTQVDPNYSSYVNENGEIIVQLDKALYGCIQSARLWYETLKAALIEFGYVENEMDPCVFNKSVDGVQSTLLVHVDDILCLCKIDKEHDDLANFLRGKFGESKYTKASVLSFLGMTIDFTVAGKVSVRTEGYVKDLLDEYGIDGVAESPANRNLFDEVPNDELLPEHERERFHKFVAKLLYLTRRTRPDIGVATVYLCTKVQRATVGDQAKLDRVMRYLNNTQDQSVVLEAAEGEQLMLLAFIDASFGVHVDGKSHSGMFVTLGRGPILVRSSKQKMVTRSSTEAELVALSDNVNYVVWIRDFIIGQGYEIAPAVVYQDNTSTIAIVGQGTSVQDRTKHIKVRRLAVKELVDNGSITIVHMPTAMMIADVLTKPLQGTLFRRMRRNLTNYV